MPTEPTKPDATERTVCRHTRAALRNLIEGVYASERQIARLRYYAALLSAGCVELEHLPSDVKQLVSAQLHAAQSGEGGK